MRRHILTGAPGAGKTALLRRLETLGFSVVEEAATDVIALEQAQGRDAPHTDPGFILSILDLQQRRLAAAAALPVAVQFHDRSAICTHALCQFLGYRIPPDLARETARLSAEGVYGRRVLFIENQGFVTATPARRISFEDALVFEAVHERTYLEFGYELVRIPAQPLDERVAAVLRAAG